MEITQIEKEEDESVSIHFGGHFLGKVLDVSIMGTSTFCWELIRLRCTRCCSDMPD